MGTNTKDRLTTQLRLFRRLLSGESMLQRDMQETLGYTHSKHMKAYLTALETVLPDLKKRKQGRFYTWARASSEDLSERDRLHRVLGLRFAAEALRSLRGAPWVEALDHMARAEAQQLEALQHIPDTLADAFHVVPSGRATTEQPAVVEQLTEAWRRRVLCTLRYRKVDGEVRQRDIEVCGLLLRGDHAIVVGRHDNGHEAQQRYYRLDRVESVRLLSQRHPRRRGGELRDVAAHSWGLWLTEAEPVDVRVSVRGHWRGLFSTFQQHPTQQITGDDGTWLSLSWRVRLCPELEGSLMSMMPDVRIEGPQELRERVRKRVDQGLATL